MILKTLETNLPLGLGRCNQKISSFANFYCLSKGFQLKLTEIINWIDRMIDPAANLVPKHLIGKAFSLATHQ
jgi:hypothetical protein